MNLSYYFFYLFNKISICITLLFTKPFIIFAKFMIITIFKSILELYKSEKFSHTGKFFYNKIDLI